ncbi:MAG: hypothetical protein LBL80_01170 [Ruminococcus sp.]|jgi:hypothetical protein|nr:hypothetical protein [Ruminococcus sp.]
MKIAKAALAAILSLSMLTACGADTTTFGTINGKTIPVGIYINYQYMAYNTAQNKVAEQQAEAAAAAEAAVTAVGETTAAAPALPKPGAVTLSPAESATVPFLSDVIGGVPVRDYITEEAIEDVREYAAVNQKFTELGLSYTDNEDVSVKNYIEENWDYFSEALSTIGISRASYEDVMLNSLKRQEIFMYYYGPGGEKAVSDEIIKEYLLENNARIDYIPMVLKDGEGNLLKSDGKAEQMKMAEDYVSRASAGEEFTSLLAEYNDYFAGLTPADTAAEPETDEVDPNAESQTATNETVITKDGTTPTASVVTKVFEEQTAHPGETRYFIVEDSGGEYYYVVKLSDLFSDPTFLELNREQVISTLYSEEFDETVRGWTSDQEMFINEKSIERYKVEKFENLQ